ncbi:heat shock protein 15 [Oxobacter pfennigii]|uniref:RQC P-site tRNA stabilizing factor n=1 Tax=Oxobacter pfennigii TaxID=36849 RepID=A0A0P8W5A4_9CLOT|nr:RNA-binding S4 domain-containing protein [Oxobacter pfennigii]KPU42779.1 heat shock protein 15 [Oxobacter pfennigii]
MRLDKYLKVSRIIKRRTVAKEACDTGRVSINGKVAKPGTEVNVNDIIEIRFGNRMLKAEILDVAENVKKEGAAAMYRVVEGEDTF